MYVSFFNRTLINPNFLLLISMHNGKYRVSPLKYNINFYNYRAKTEPLTFINLQLAAMYIWNIRSEIV